MADGLLTRERLLTALSVPPKIRVISAPSGFGKTTLLKSWVDGIPPADRAVVWVALSAEVPTRKEFWQLVGASAVRGNTLDPVAFRTLLGRANRQGDPVPTIARAIERGGLLTLAIDAYEWLRGITDTIDDDLLRLAAAAPQLDVVVTTRAATALSDEVRVLRGEVRVIDETALRFTADEVAEMLTLHAPHAIDAAGRIVADTHGYPLGVRAVVYALERQERVPALDSAAWSRLVTRDLKSQIADPALAEFVLETSVAPYFDGALAGALTGADPATVDAALTELAWSGFGRWTPYARESPAFQYVESVREVFLAQLRTDHPERYARLAGIAADWLHRHDDHDLALGLAIDGHRLDLASNICRSLVVSNPDIYNSDQFERHLRRVPRAQLAHHPVLAFIRGMVLGSNPSTRAAAADYLRVGAAHALDGIDEMAAGQALYHYIGREVCLRYLGRTSEAADTARRALQHIESMSAADRDELGEFLAMAFGIIAYSLFQVGDVEVAGTVVERAAAAATSPWWRNYALAFAAGIHGLDGRGGGARSALALTDPEAVVYDPRGSLPLTLGITGHAAVLLDDLDFAGAIGAYDAAGELVEVAESWPAITWVLAHARLGLGEAGSEAERIAAALASTPAPPGLGPNLATAALYNALATLWLVEGNAVEARRLLRSTSPCRAQLAPGRLLDQLITGDPAAAVRNVPELLAEPGHTIRSTVAIDTLGAAAALRAGNDQTATRLLERAASRHQLFGVRVQLLYLPAADLEALRQLAATTGNSATVDYLAVPIVSLLRPAELTPVTLTRREAAVLEAWARHRTRSEVAAELFVSPNTVRSQLSSAYRKLGVTSKDAAIQRAIELDLLRPADCS